jgi:undecaprenyl-diphosphatase
MAVAFGFELAVQKALKHGLKRPRPCLAVPGVRNLVSIPDDFSFPSGHTAGAFLAAVQVSSLVPATAAPLFVTAALVGLSRIYNGVHYPSDVAAGALLGAASGLLGLALV